MYEELKIVFPIVNGTIQEYEDDRMGIFTINVSDKDYPAVADYLTKHGMRWRDLSSNAN